MPLFKADFVILGMAHCFSRKHAYRVAFELLFLKRKKKKIDMLLGARNTGRSRIFSPNYLVHR